MTSTGEDFSQFGISNEEKDKLVGELIRYVLFKTEQNNGCPIKREELTQIITDKKYRQRHLPNFVINEAKSKLSSIFGYDMRELQRSRPSELDMFSAYAEENLWHHLRRLGLSEMEESHPVLGNIKQTLEALVQQRYLQKDKVSGPEANTLYYEFAERAQDEAVSRKIKDYISQIVQKDPSPTDADD